jgi:hypothetical protein
MKSCWPSGLSRYLASMKKTPKAAHKLVTSHLRLVAKIAMGYRGYGLPIAEVISEGNVGLMQAVKKFDPDKGFRLATYAMWWIKRLDPGIHPALLVAGQDGHHGGSEEAVLQSAPDEEPDGASRKAICTPIRSSRSPPSWASPMTTSSR